VLDQAGMFSPEAVRRAEDVLRTSEVEHRWQTLIKTIKTLDGQKIRDRAITEANERGLAGVVILISKDDHKFIILPTPDAEAVFGKPQLDAITQAFIRAFNDGKNDQGLESAVAKIRNVTADTGDKPTLVLDAGGHTAKVTNVLFTPDGRELITVSQDKTIRTWDVATGEPLRVLRPPIGRGREGQLYAAALSPDGRTLAVGGFPPGWRDDGFPVYLISLSAGRIERVLKGHTEEIKALAFGPDGRRLASASPKTSVIY